MTKSPNGHVIKNNKIDNIGLLQYFDRDLMEQFQQALVKATGLAFITVDYRGMPVTECTNFCAHCQRVRNDEQGRESCHSSDAYGAIQAAVSQKPHIYFCSHGMIEMAVPIVVKGQYMGGFIGGQIRCDDAPDSISRLDRLQPVHESDEAKRQRLKLFKEVPRVPYTQIVNVANLVSLIINQLCVRALEKPVIEEAVSEEVLDVPENLLSEGQYALIDTLVKLAQSGAYSRIHQMMIQVIQAVKAPGWLTFGTQLFNRLGIPTDGSFCHIPDTIPEDRSGIEWIYQVVEAGCQYRCSCSYPLMKDVFLYLEHHINEDISLKDIVSHCDISQGYLSRILKKYYGVSVMEYIHLRKLLAAKLDLIFTSDSVEAIAQRYGYSSRSYFCKIFKKYESMTCRAYKQAYQRYS